MERLQRIMIGNGLVVVLVAMLAGFMLMFSLLGGVEVWPGKIIAIPMYGSVPGWARAHTGGALNGVLVIVVALALPYLRLSDGLSRFTRLRPHLRRVVVHGVLLARQRVGQSRAEPRPQCPGGARPGRADRLPARRAERVPGAGAAHAIAAKSVLSSSKR